MFLKRILTIVLFSVSHIVYVRSQEIDTNNLKTQATEMAESFMKEDYATLAKYTYPKIVELMGGKDNMIAILKKGVEDMQKKGVTFKSVSVTPTSLKAKAGKEIHTIVAQTIVMGVPGGTLTSNSYLLAITADNGKTWRFVDTAQMTDMDKIKSVFPNYNPDLKIPKKDPPIFNKDQ